MDFRIWSLPLLAILVLLGLTVYDTNLQVLYNYQGMMPVIVDTGWVVMCVLWLSLAATVLPRRIERPSDLFLMFYVLSCMIWGSVLWSGTGFLRMEQGLLLMTLLYIPALAIKAGQRFAAGTITTFVLPIRVARRKHLYIPLALLLVIAAYAAATSLHMGGFDIEGSYERRLAGRDALSGNVLAGYAINMAVNGFAPILAFMAGWRRSPLLLAAAGGFAIMMFFLLGLKGPFLNITILGLVGFVLREKRGWHLLVPLFTVTLIAIFAYSAYEVSQVRYSALADYFVRRIAMVQPQVQSYYLHHWLGLPWGERLFGAQVYGHSDWTFLIGSKYLRNPLSNANVDAFLYALVRGGLLGYAIAVAAVAAIALSLDALYERTAAPEFVGLAGLYGILVSEQAFTTALTSSGIALCLVLAILFSYPSRRRPARLEAT